MEKAASVLKMAYQEDSEYAERIRTSLALLQSEAPVSTSAESEWTGWTVWFNLAQFSVPTGTLQALIGSGELSLVLSEELRATLIAEYAAFNRYQSWIDEVFAQALPNSNAATYEMEVLRIRAAGKIVSLDSLKESPRLTSTYLIQLNLLQNILSSLRAMTEVVDNIHAAVEKELEQRGG
jgi:hypothetical protein